VVCCPDAPFCSLHCSIIYILSADRNILAMGTRPHHTQQISSKIQEDKEEIEWVSDEAAFWIL
jgi:hypothetical protein